MLDKLKILLAQTTAANTHHKNIETLESLVTVAVEQNCDMLCLPEVSGLMNQDFASAVKMLSAEEHDPYVAACRALAAKNKLWIHNGSTPVIGDTGRPVNRTHLIDEAGSIAARYDKIHLFDIYLPDGQARLESRRYEAGAESVLVNTPWGPMGLSICYDLRFPKMYREYAQDGARIIFAPSAFTRKTGRAHWELLLRARAVENACFIVAAAQTGEHDDGRKTYGHSLVVHPWGTVETDLGEDITAKAIEMDLSEADTMRAQIPSLNHSRDYVRVTLPEC